jgi:DNA end-binding protein Ku
MEDRDRAAIGTVVIRNKQYLAAVRPLDGALAMSTMRFADEVVPRSDIDGLPSGRAKPDPKALKLAEQIVDSLTTEWDPKRYHDDYTEELRAIIDRKDRGKADVVEADEAGAEKEAEVLDLMAALERSVSEAKSKRADRTSRRPRAKAPARRKAAPARKRAAKRASA